MKTMTKLLGFLAILALNNCAPVHEHDDVCSTSQIALKLPTHVGCGDYGEYGLYSYIIYKDSVSIKANSAEMEITSADIFDLDKDGKLDSVYIKKEGTWRFISSLKGSAKPFEDTLPPTYLCNYLGLGHHVRNLAKEKKQTKDSFMMPLGKLQKMFWEQQ